MQIPGLGQLPHARSVTMQVMQGFCTNNSFYYQPIRAVVNQFRRVGPCELTVEVAHGGLRNYVNPGDLVT